MDLFFANLVTIVFFITGYKLIEKAIFPMPSTLLKIALYSLLIFCCLGITSILFAIAIGLWLPGTYSVTFSYKSLFICPIITLYFSFNMMQNKRLVSART
tara:strand:- start:2494 stop:2793 length:300 start_codon:yes stop_codon:yes gene_type:complete